MKRAFYRRVGGRKIFVPLQGRGVSLFSPIRVYPLLLDELCRERIHGFDGLELQSGSLLMLPEVMLQGRRDQNGEGGAENAA